MVPKTRRGSPAKSGAEIVSVPWDPLLNALLKTACFSSITKEALALLRRLPPLPADMAAGAITGSFIDRPVTRGQALAQIRMWVRKAGGAFALLRWALNPHRQHDMNFTRRSFNLVALGQDDGMQVLSLTSLLSLHVEPRDTNWPSGTMFLILKNPRG